MKGMNYMDKQDALEMQRSLRFESTGNADAFYH